MVLLIGIEESFYGMRSGGKLQTNSHGGCLAISISLAKKRFRDEIKWKDKTPPLFGTRLGGKNTPFLGTKIRWKNTPFLGTNSGGKTPLF